jgi:uncharacterized protein (TIGR00369 family)
MPGLTTAEAERILADMFAPWVLDLGLSVEAVGDDSAVLRMAFSKRLCRVGGMVCGQAMVSAADTAMVIAISAAKGGFLPIGTVDMTVNYMRPASNSDLLVEAKVMRVGRTMGFCTAMVKAATDGKDCAHVVGTYAMPAEKA